MAWTQTYKGDEAQRINKWLAQSGVCSRREAEGLIEQGLISIDGETVIEPGRKISPGETLTLADAATDKLASAISIILNKPTGYVSAHPNKDEIPAARLLTKANLQGEAETIPTRDTRLAPVGRLDMDSRGLLILSEDGVLTKAVIGPDADSEKEYLVTVNGKITPDKVKRLCHGLKLDKRELKPAIITQEGPQDLRFILKEGRNRQIRRMCELVGLHVIDLFRIRIGNVTIGNLDEGKWRPLTESERTGLVSKIPNPDKTSIKPSQHAKPHKNSRRNGNAALSRTSRGSATR